MESIKKILICRTDNVGKLLLTLPLFHMTRKVFPRAFIGALVNPQTAELLSNNPWVDRIIIDDTKDKHEGPAGFLRLARLIESHHFDTALLPHCNWRLASLAVSAGIKRRVAVGSNSFLPLINRPLWLERNKSSFHESRYTLAFLKPLGVDVSKVEAPRLFLTETELQRADDFLESKGLSTTDTIMGLHPARGMLGFTMSPDRWVQAVKVCSKALRTKKILITGSTSERSLCERLAAALKMDSIVTAGELNFRELSAVQSYLSLMIGPCCGPLYTAAAVGTPVITFFPPPGILSAQKWHPLAEKVAIVQRKELHCKKCKRENCKHYPCLDDFPNKVIETALAELLPLP